MKLTNSEIIQVLNVFDELADKDLPAELGFDLYSIHSKCLEIYSNYIKALNKKMQKEGVESPAELKDQEEVKRLLQRKSDINLPKVKKEQFKDLSLTLSQIMALSSIIDG